MSENHTCVKMQLVKTTYKGWQILYNGDKTLFGLVDDIAGNRYEKHIKRKLKNNSRSLLVLIEYNGKSVLLKNPREKNTRKWIRFTTLYRKGEAFKNLMNLAKLDELQIDANKPLLAMEKRKFGMVFDSWLVYEFKPGVASGESNYADVVRKLKIIHDQNLLHGDAQIENFIVQNDAIITLDAQLKKPILGRISKFTEYLYLQKSAPGIEHHFDIDTSGTAYRLAATYSRLYWSWRAFKKKKRLKKRQNLKFLVIRLSSIGDVILTTPVLAALKHKYPDASIDFVVMDTFKDAISGNPHIDSLILFDKNKYKGITGIYDFTRTLKSKRYDYIIDLHAKIRSRLISFLVTGKVLRYKKRALWKSLLVPLGWVRYHVDDTIVRNYFAPLKRIHVYFSGEDLSFYFRDQDAARVRSFQGAVVMAPGAANPTKKWLPDHFAALGQMLNEPVVLIGGREEFQVCEEICKTIGEKCQNLAGQLSLKESGALIAGANFIVCNDSGPFHMARGTRTKAYVIFGPTDPDMFSYNQKSVLIYAGLDCSPCSLHGDKKCPKGHFNCMLTLTPESVYKIIKSNEIAMKRDPA